MIAFRWIGLAAVFAASAGHAKDPEHASILDAVKRQIPGATVEWVRPSPSPQLLAVKLEGRPTPVWITADARVLIPEAAAAIDTATRRDEQERYRAEHVRAVLGEIPEESKIVFESPQETDRLTVLTDASCGYCRKLHTEIEQFLAAGISIEYVLYARGGPDGEGWPAHRAVLCATDRVDALTRVMAGERITASACDQSPGAAQRALASLQVTGTPAIYTADGFQLGGYVTAAAARANLDLLAAVRSARRASGHAVAD